MKRLVMLAQALLALGIAAWAGCGLDWQGGIARSFPVVSGAGLALLLGIRGLTYAGLGARLAALARDRKEPAARPLGVWLTTRAAILCIGCNNLLPARLGEVCKIVWLHGQSGFPVPDLLGMTVMERGLDVTLLLALGLVFGGVLLNVPHLAWLIVLLVVFWVGAAVLMNRPGTLETWMRRMRVRLERRGPPLLIQAGRFVERFALALGGRCGAGVLGQGLVWSALIWGLNYAHAWTLVNVLLPLELTPQQVGVLTVALFGSSALFLIPGGYGLMEGAVAGVLVLFGVETDRAVVAALWARVYYTFVPLALTALIVAFDRQSGGLARLLRAKL